MAKQLIGIGTAANDGTGDPLRTAFNKANLNFTELYSAAQFNIKIYGAVGDDSTNNTVAIQAAIDAAAASGGVVVVPQGIFKTAAVTVPKNVNIVGTSYHGSVLKANASGVLITHTGVDAFDAANYFAPLGAPGISNLTLDGAATGTDGLYITEVSRAQVRDVLVKNFLGKGFRNEGVVNGRWDNCHALHCAHGWYFKKVASSTVYGPGNVLPPNLNVLTNCTTLFNTVWGVYYTDGDGLFLNQCDVESNGTNANAATGGVYFAGDSNNSTTGLIVHGGWYEGQTGGAHIEIANTDYLLLHAIRDTVFLDFVGDALPHCIKLGGGGSAVNKLTVDNSASMPSRSTVFDIYGSGANSSVNIDEASYFTRAGTIGRWFATNSDIWVIPVGDETTTITTGTAKVTFRAPRAATITAVRASVNTVSSSGTPTFDINDGGTTILSTKLTIDASEKTSVTAATPAVISDTALAADAEITIDIDVAGTGAKGAKIEIDVLY